MQWMAEPVKHTPHRCDTTPNYGSCTSKGVNTHRVEPQTASAEAPSIGLGGVAHRRKHAPHVRH